MWPQMLHLHEICHKPMNKSLPPDDDHAEVCAAKLSEPRADAACLSFPGIVVRSERNPCRLPYRMLDGSHRVCALLKQGVRIGARRTSVGRPMDVRRTSVGHPSDVRQTLVGRPMDV